MKLRAILVALFALASCQQVLAWGADGHQLVGSIADRLLNPNARQQVASILGFELRVAAPWADCVRSVVRHSDGTFEYISNPQFSKPCLSFEQGAEKARMEDYVRRNWNACVVNEGKKSCADTFHFADVAIQHDHYERGFTGTNDHDVVAAIGAAVAVLKGQPSPAPFSIKDKKEALFLLAHFVGDLHQPLHVGAVYLSTAGKRLNPDVKASAKSAKETRGGNLIFLKPPSAECKGNDLHSEWDDILDSLGTSASDAMVAKAKAVPPTPGAVESFAAGWATDSVVTARSAFKGVSFRKACEGHWSAKFANRKAYRKSENATKEQQLAKGGAHLAQLLNTIWP